MNEKNLKYWQSKISYVPQKLFLFDDTIKNNITLGQDINYFDEKKFKKATMISTVNDFVEKLDEKYDTLVKDEGTRFWWTNSKNKFSKSYIFFKEILVLDEFTNQIDKESELKIIEDLFFEFKNSTIILVTHNEKIKKLCREVNLSKIYNH